MPDERYFSTPSAEVGGDVAQEPSLELLAMGSVADPFARGRDQLTGCNRCGMADHGHDITMPARLGPGVVVGDTPRRGRPALPGLMILAVAAALHQSLTANRRDGSSMTSRNVRVTSASHPDSGHIDASHRSATKSADARRSAVHHREHREAAGAVAPGRRHACVQVIVTFRLQTGRGNVFETQFIYPTGPIDLVPRRKAH
jgi:hypothetical protein